MEIKFSLDTLETAAREFAELMQSSPSKVFAFDAEMGAGKTTFISRVCEILGADDDFGSPTFSIVNEYADAEGNPIYHFDFYRIDSLEEAIDMGAEEYFYSGHPCFIEWPGKIGALLPEDAVKVAITINEDGSRTLSC